MRDRGSFLTRLEGVGQAIGGFFGIIGGASLSFFSSGTLSVIGGAMVVCGIDEFNTGMKKVFNGEHVDTALAQSLQMTGMSVESSRMMDNGFKMSLSIGAFVGVKAGIYAAESGIAKISTQISKTSPSALTSVASTTLPKELGSSRSTYQAQLLKTHLRQIEQYGSGGYRQLSSGKVRYYGEMDSAKLKGEMAGRRLVREWDPESGLKRTWHETLDNNGNVRIVRPEKNDGNKIHYLFDSNGNFIGVK